MSVRLVQSIRMNIIEYALFALFLLAGLVVFVGGLPVVREELDRLQELDNT